MYIFLKLGTAFLALSAVTVLDESTGMLAGMKTNKLFNA